MKVLKVMMSDGRVYGYRLDGNVAAAQMVVMDDDDYMMKYASLPKPTITALANNDSVRIALGS